MTSEQTIKDRGVEALKIAAGWTGADRTTIVTLATILAATGADADGLGYFEDGKKIGEVYRELA